MQPLADKRRVSCYNLWPMGEATAVKRILAMAAPALTGAVLLLVIAISAGLFQDSGAEAAPAGQLPCTSPPCATVSIDSTTSYVGLPAVVNLNVSNIPPSGLGSWTVDIGYDGTVLSVLDCAPVNGGICNPTFSTFIIRVTGNSAGGRHGSTVVGNITFQCERESVANLILSLELLADTTLGNPQLIPATVVNGTVTCSGGAPPPPPTAVPPTDTPRPADTSTPRPANTNTPRPGDTPRPPDTPTDTPANTATSEPAQQTETALAPSPTEGPSPTLVPSPSPEPTSEVLGIVDPGSSNGGPGDAAREPSILSAAAAVRPETTTAITSMFDVSTEPEVIATNIALALFLLIVLLVTSSIFNDTIDQNRAEVEARADWLVAPFRLFGNVMGQIASAFRIPRVAQRALAPLFILVLASVIYSFNEPVIGFNETSALLFFSLLISVGILTYIFEGGMALISQFRYKVPSDVKLFPIAIVIAIAFVILSRIVGFQAPIMYGFVAVATMLSASRLRDSHEATTAAIPALVLLGVSLLAWALIGPLRDASASSASWYASLPSETAAMIFAGGVEGLVFAMIPVKFSDGWPIFRSLKPVWAVLFIVPAFVFSWAILNPAASDFDALIQGRVLTVIGIVGAYTAAVVAIWVYFNFSKFDDKPGEAVSA